MAVQTANELAAAMRRNEPEIQIIGDLRNQVLIVRALGTAAWVVIGAILAAILLMIIASGGLITPALGPALAPVVAVAGPSGTQLIVAMAAAGGGMGLLRSLSRDYYVVSNDGNILVLGRR